MFNYIPYIPDNNSIDNTKKKKGVSCSWCFKGCKNKKVYTSHYLQNRNGDIICPKLLKSVCRNCGQTGHIMGKFCPEPQKSDHLLLPRKERSRVPYNYRESDTYSKGDSDYFPLSSDDESDDEKNNKQLMEIAINHHPCITDIRTNNASPELMHAMRNFLQPVPTTTTTVVPTMSWSKKLFPK